MPYRQVDGDTWVDSDTGERFRLAGGNAAEKSTPAGAVAAADMTTLDRVNAAQRTRLGHDYYGRAVTQFTNPDSSSLNQQLITEGKARAVDYTGAGQMFNPTVPATTEPTAQQYALMGGASEQISSDAGTPPPERNVAQKFASSLDRAWANNKAGYYGAVSAVGNLIARDPDGAGPQADTRTVPDYVKDAKGNKVRNPDLSLRDRFSNWLQRTGEKGYMRNSQEAKEFLPKTATFKGVLEGKDDLLSLVAESLGEAVPSILEMVGTGAAVAATGGLGAAALGAAASRGALGAGAKAMATRFAEQQLTNAVRKRIVAGAFDPAMKGMAQVEAQQMARGVVANLPEYATRFAANKPVIDALRAKSVAGWAGGQAAGIGGRLGAFGSSAGMQAGQFYEEDKNAEGGVASPGRSLLAGAAAGALDLVGIEFLLHRFLKPGVDIKTAMDVVKHVGAQGALGMGGEGATEAVQEVIGVLNNEWDAKTDVPLLDRMTSKENLWRYAEAGVAGAIFGGMFGGAGGAVSGMVNKQSTPTPSPEPTSPGAPTTEPVLESAPGAGPAPLDETAPPVEPAAPTGPIEPVGASEAPPTESPVVQAPPQSDPVVDTTGQPPPLPPSEPTRRPGPPVETPTGESQGRQGRPIPPSEAPRVLKTDESVVIKPTESVAEAVSKVEPPAAEAPAALPVEGGEPSDLGNPVPVASRPVPVAPSAPPAPALDTGTPAIETGMNQGGQSSSSPLSGASNSVVPSSGPAPVVEPPKAKPKAKVKAKPKGVPAPIAEAPPAPPAPETQTSGVAESPLSIKAKDRNDPRLSGEVFRSEAEAKPLQDALWELGVHTGIEDETQTPFALRSVASETNGAEWTAAQSGVLGYAQLHAVQKALDAVGGDPKALKTALDANPKVIGATYDRAYAAAVGAGLKPGEFVVGMRGKAFAYAPLKAVAKAETAKAEAPKARLFEGRWTRDTVTADPAAVYVFGDNAMGRGNAGQAVIRGMPNAMGIPTKHLPSTSDGAYFKDIDGKIAPEPKRLIDAAIARIKATGKPVVFSAGGLGTGLSKLQNAPATLAYLNQAVKEAFGVDLTLPAKAEAPTAKVGPSPAKMAQYEAARNKAKAATVTAKAEAPAAAAPTAKAKAPTVNSLSAASTGKAFSVEGFQGRGYTPTEIYGEHRVKKGAGVPVAGPGDYVAITQEQASRYGATVSPRSVVLSNPLVVSTTQEWNDLVRAAKAPHLISTSREAFTDLPGYSASTLRLQAYVRGLGHDGLVIRNTEDLDNRRLKETFGHDQVVKFTGPVPKTEALVAKAEAPTPAATEPSPEEVAAKRETTLARVVKEYTEHLGKAAVGLAAKFAVSPEGTRKGSWNRATHTASLSAEILDILGGGTPNARQVMLAKHILAHELGHALDSSGEGEQYYSEQSPLFAIDRDKLSLDSQGEVDAKPGWAGPLMAELYAAHLKARSLGKSHALQAVHAFERYGFHKLVWAVENKDANLFAHTQREVFAQAHGIYLTSPRLLKQIAPLTYQLLEDVYGHETNAKYTTDEIRVRVREAFQRANTDRGARDGGVVRGRGADSASQGRAENQPADRNVQGPAPARPGELDPSALTEADAEEGINAAIQAYWKSPTYLDNPTQYKINVLAKVLREKQGGLLNYVLNTYSPQANKARALTEAAAKKRQEGAPKTPFDSKRQSPTPGQTPKQFRQAIQHKLLDRANVNVLHRTQDAPFKVAPDTAGLYLPDGSSWFFTENIAPGEEWGKVFHELGAHYGLARMVGRDAYARILKDLKGMVTGEGFASVKEAYRRALAAGATGAGVYHETLGYLAELSPRHGLVRRLLTAVRQFLRSIGLVKAYTDADLIGLIQTAALKEGLEGRVGLDKGQLASATTDLNTRVRAMYDAAPETASKVTREVYKVWQQIAAASDANFKFGVSTDRDLQTIADEMVGPGAVEVVYENPKTREGDVTLHLKKTGAEVVIHNIDRMMDSNPMLYMPESRRNGQSGQAIALIETAMAWAANNDIHLDTDSFLTEVNAYSRYNAALLSSAVRYDSTAHIEPNPYRVEYATGFKEGADGRLTPVSPRSAELGKGKTPIAKIYQWQEGTSRAATEYNIGMLAMREAEQVMAVDPVFQELDYDFTTGKLAHNGKDLDSAGFGRIVQSSRLRGYDNALGLGETTIMRAVVTQAALRRIAESGRVATTDRGLSGSWPIRRILNSKRTDTLTIEPTLDDRGGQRLVVGYGIFGNGQLLESFDSAKEAAAALKKNRAEYEGYLPLSVQTNERPALANPRYMGVLENLDKYLDTYKREQKDPPDVIRSEDRPFSTPKKDLRTEYYSPQTQAKQKFAEERLEPLGPNSPREPDAHVVDYNAALMRHVGQLHAASPEGDPAKPKLASHLAPTPLTRLEAPALAAMAESLRAIKDPEDAAEHALSLMAAPEAEGVAHLLNQYRRIFAQNLPPERTLGAIEYLYATTLQQSDHLRALTAFVSQDDLPLHEHLLRALDAFDALRHSDSSTVADIERNMLPTAEADTAFGQKERDYLATVKAQQEVGNSAGEMQVQSLYERDMLVHDTMYPTATLGEVISPLVTRTDNANSQASKDEKSWRARKRMPALEQQLLALQDQAAANPSQTAEVALGDMDAWLDGRPLTEAGEQLRTAMKKGKPAGQESKLLADLQLQRAWHDATAAPYGVLVLKYDAQRLGGDKGSKHSGRYLLVERITTFDPDLLQLVEDPKTKDLVTPKEWLRRLISEVTAYWDDRLEARDRDFWKDNVLEFHVLDSLFARSPGDLDGGPVDIAGSLDGKVTRKIAMTAKQVVQIGEMMYKAIGSPLGQTPLMNYEMGLQTLLYDAGKHYVMTQASEQVSDRKLLAGPYIEPGTVVDDDKKGLWLGDARQAQARGQADLGVAADDELRAFKAWVDQSGENSKAFKNWLKGRGLGNLRFQESPKAQRVYAALLKKWQAQQTNESPAFEEWLDNKENVAFFDWTDLQGKEAETTDGRGLATEDEQAGYSSRMGRIGETSTKATGETVLPHIAGVTRHEGTEAHGVVSKIVKALNLNSIRVSLYNRDDVNDLLDAVEPYTQTYNRLRQGLFSATPKKAAVAFIDGRILLYYDKNLTGKELAWALGHEMGHVVLRTVLENERRRSTVLWRRLLNQYQASESPESFMEWFADQAADWSLQDRSPKNLIEAFYRRVVDYFNKLLGAIGAKVTPNAVHAYLDGLALKERGMEYQALAEALRGTTRYDLLTLQQTYHGADTMQHLVLDSPELDFLSPTGAVKKTAAAVKEWIKAHQRVNATVQSMAKGGRTLAEWGHDVLDTTGGWLRGLNNPAATMLADMLDNGARVGVDGLLNSPGDVRAALEAINQDIRKRNLARDPGALPEPFVDVNALTGRAAQIFNNRKRDGLLGVKVVTSLSRNGRRTTEVVPQLRESFTAAVNREDRGHWGASEDGYYKFWHKGTTEAEYQAIGEELLRNDPKSQRAKDIAAWLKNFFDAYVAPGFTGAYSKNREVHIGFREDWGMARFYSPDKIAANRQAFLDLLMTDDDSVGWVGMEEAQARNLTARIETGVELLPQEQPTTLLSPGASSRKRRNIPLAIDKLLPFLETDISKTLPKYVHSMVRRVEWDRRFSDEKWNGKKWVWHRNVFFDTLRGAAEFNNDLPPQRQAQIREQINGIGEAAMGRYGAMGADPRVRTGMSFIQTATNFLVLPLAALSQGTDFASPFIRTGGDLKNSLKGMREAFTAMRNTGGDVYKMAEMMGVIFRDTRNAFAASYLDAPYMTEGAQKWNDALFKWNGMQWLTTFNRIAAWQTSGHWLRDIATNGHPDAKRVLAQLDLTTEDLTEWRKQEFPDYTNGAGKDSVAYKVATARTRFVQESNFAPNATQRPLWANHPYMMLLWSLKSFTYSYFTQMLKPIMRELWTNPRWGSKAAATLPLLVLIPLAMAGMGIRDELKYGLGRTYAKDPKENDDWLETTGKVISRTGLMGPLQLLVDADTASSYGRSFIFALTSPALSKVEEAFRAGNMMPLTPGLSMLPAERQALMRWMAED